MFYLFVKEYYGHGNLTYLQPPTYPIPIKPRTTKVTFTVVRELKTGRRIHSPRLYLPYGLFNNPNVILTNTLGPYVQLTASIRAMTCRDAFGHRSYTARKLEEYLAPRR
jgi:hypothetical protein